MNGERHEFILRLLDERDTLQVENGELKAENAHLKKEIKTLCDSVEYFSEQLEVCRDIVADYQNSNSGLTLWEGD